MVSSKTQVLLWKILIVLEIINYQVVTILCNDIIVLKFMRDIVLVLILFAAFYKTKFKIDRTFIFILVFLLFVGIAFLRTDGLRVAITNARRYISPLVLLVAIRNAKFVTEDTYVDILKFLLGAFFVFCVWGIFQAYVLGPEFLIKIGYPTKYSNVFKGIALRDSYYFGNMSIQRVVGTLSNSNVCALILGSIIICCLVNYKRILNTKFDIVCIIGCVAGYILTFSRANFLAFIIVSVIFLWKYIPKKKYIFIAMAGALGLFVILYFVQGENGITHKLVKWVVNSLTFKESSVAGRRGIWAKAAKAVIENPLGIGFGRTGAGAVGNIGLPVYSCENSYLAMALDMSILGLVAFLLFIGSLIKEIMSMGKSVTMWKKMLGAIFTYMGITYMFSNHIYDREANMVLFFLIALTMNFMKKKDMEQTDNKSTVKQKAN